MYIYIYADCFNILCKNHVCLKVLKRLSTLRARPAPANAAAPSSKNLTLPSGGLFLGAAAV